MTILVTDPNTYSIEADLLLSGEVITAERHEERLDPDGGYLAEAESMYIPCRMAFAEQGALLALAEQNGCPQGSLICKPDERDQRVFIIRPDEFHSLDLQVQTTARVDLEERDEEGRWPQVTVDPFSVVGWDALRRLAVTDDADAGHAARWVEGINTMLNRIQAQLEEGDRGTTPPPPPAQISMLLCCQIADRVEPAELPQGVDYDLLARHCAHEELQIMLRGLRDEPPARPASTALAVLRLEGHRGIQIASGGRMRSMLISAAGNRNSLDGPFARRNDTLVRSIFAPMTRTPVENITAAMMSKAAWDELNASIREYENSRTPAELEKARAGPWQEQVAREAQRILEDVFGRSYQPEVNIHVIGDNDVLMVRDHAGHYLYSWPSADRQILFAPDTGIQIPMIEINEVPTARLLADLRAEVTQHMIRLAEQGAREEREYFGAPAVEEQVTIDQADTPAAPATEPQARPPAQPPQAPTGTPVYSGTGDEPEETDSSASPG